MGNLVSGSGRTDKTKSKSVVLATDDPLGAILTAPTSYTIPFIKGELGGRALSIDPDPNSKDPGEPAPDNAVFRVRQAQGVLSFGNTFLGTVSEFSGSLTQQPWIYDDVRGRWFKFGAAAAVGIQSQLTIVGASMMGMKLFFQVTANGSSITQWYIILR